MLRNRGEGKTYRKRDGRREHQVVAERALGRALLPGETVHHLDGDIRNNDPSNLVVLDSQSEHMKEHARINALKRWGKIPRSLGHLQSHEYARQEAENAT